MNTLRGKYSYLLAVGSIATVKWLFFSISNFSLPYSLYGLFVPSIPVFIFNSLIVPGNKFRLRKLFSQTKGRKWISMNH